MMAFVGPQNTCKTHYRPIMVELYWMKPRLEMPPGGCRAWPGRTIWTTGTSRARPPLPHPPSPPSRRPLPWPPGPTRGPTVWTPSTPLTGSPSFPPSSPPRPARRPPSGGSGSPPGWATPWSPARWRQTVPLEVRHCMSTAKGNKYPIVGGFGCLKLCRYDIRELTSASRCQSRTSRGPVWMKDRPRISWSAETSELFTIMILDEGIPSLGGQQYAHWLVTNVPGDGNVLEGTEMMRYVEPFSASPDSPPHPMLVLVYRQQARLEFEEYQRGCSPSIISARSILFKFKHTL